MQSSKTKLPQIPQKKYFSIGETSYLCAVKPHVLRYWEQEFAELDPAKRTGGRRYYTKDDILLLRHISELLYKKKFTISGAKQELKNFINAKTDESNIIFDKTQDKNILKEIISELESLLCIIEPLS